MRRGSLRQTGISDGDFIETSFALDAPDVSLLDLDKREVTADAYVSLQY